MGWSMWMEFTWCEGSIAISIQFRKGLWGLFDFLAGD